MKISELVSKLDYHFNTLAGIPVTDPEKARVLRRTEISGIVNDSRKIAKDCLFFCIVGANWDGHEFARQALLDGASALVVEKDLDLSDLEGKTPAADPVIIRVQDTRYAMAYIAAAYYGNPKPLFVTRNIRLLFAKVLGKNRNVIRLDAQDDTGARMNLIRFGDADEFAAGIDEGAGKGAFEGLLRGAGNVTIDMVYYPDVNSWNGRESMQYIVKDFRIHGVRERTPAHISI